MTVADLLSDPEVLKALGRREYYPGTLGALIRGQLQRTVQGLELIRRRCEATVAMERNIAWAIGRWIELAGAGHPSAITMMRDPFVALWTARVLTAQTKIDDESAFLRLLSPEIGTADSWQATVAYSDSLTLGCCGGVLTGPPLDAIAVVEISCKAGCLTLTTPVGTAVFVAGEPPDVVGELRWRSAPQIDVSLRGRHLSVRLDDSDSLTAAVGHRPVEVLSDHTADDWSAAVVNCWRLLVDRHENSVESIAALVAVVVPQHSDDPSQHVSASSADAFGAIALSLSADAATMAVAFVHETHHLVLNALMDVVDLHRADGVARYYAGWRDDPRPFHGLLHGVYAFSAVTEFWRTEYLAQHDPSARLRYGFEYALWAAQTSASLQALLDAEAATPSGYAFLSGIQTLAHGWTTPQEPMLMAAVADVMAEHRLRWDLQHAGENRSLETDFRRAWRCALAGADLDTLSPPLHPVEYALVSGACGRALDLAKAGVAITHASPEDVFRLSRVKARMADTATSELLVEQIRAGKFRPAQQETAGCP